MRNIHLGVIKKVKSENLDEIRKLHRKYKFGTYQMNNFEYNLIQKLKLREEHEMIRAKEKAILRELSNLDKNYVKKFDEMFSYDEEVKLNL